MPETDVPAHRAVRPALSHRLLRALRRPWSVATVYLAIAIPFGLFFALWIPPSQILDESAHWSRVWDITEGHVVADVELDPNSQLNVNTATYPECVPRYVDRFQEVATSPEAFDFGSFWRNPEGCSNSRTTTVVGAAGGNYSLWTYPGHVTGVALARLAGLSVPWVFHVGRLFGFVCTVLLCWYAIRQAPRAQLCLAFTALLPMSLIGASGFSADGLVLGTSLILFSSALRFAEPERRMRPVDLAVVSLALGALVLSKPPFAVLALLFVCYSPKALGNRRTTLIGLATVTVAVAMLSVLWSRFGYPAEAGEVFRPDVDEFGQIRWIITHPLAYANTISDTFFWWDSQEFVVRGWVGAFGMFRTGVAESPLIMPIFVVIASGALAVFSVAERGLQRQFQTTLGSVRAMAPYATVVLGVLALYTSAYVAWDRVGASRIYGVQGRYFIPLLPLAAVGVALRHDRPAVPIRARALVVVSIVLLIASAVKIFNYFYLVS